MRTPATARKPSLQMERYEKRCLETLETALGRTAMYESWRDRDPGGQFSVEERFAALPFLTKADIRAHFPHGVVPQGLDLEAALASGELSYVRTSGTADEALVNIWNQAWWDASERASWKLNAVAESTATGSRREAILASAMSVGPRSEGQRMDRARRSLGRFLFLNEFASTAEWPEDHEQRMLEELADFQPDVVEMNPSLGARLARYAARKGRTVFQPRLITFTYEFISAIQLKAIRGVFQCPTASSYGSTEAGYVLMECERGKLHQNADFCRVDFAPLPQAGGAPGVGRIFVTTFGNEWFPLLRFEIGDLLRASSAPCPCGRSFGMTADSVEGRTKSLCVASDGRLITHREIDLALARVEGLAEYQLVQQSRAVFRAAIVAEARSGRAVAEDCTETLRGLLGSTAEVSTSPVRALLPEASGKYLLVKREFPLEIP